LKLDDEQRATIAKYTANFRIVNAIHHFTKDFSELKESIVRGWKKILFGNMKKRR